MSQHFSSLKRDIVTQSLQNQDFDLLVIGGGITGAGIALDAASRGIKTALVEMQDFAAGTSSRSTKLIHGGLRYLKKFELKLVSEVGKERTIIYENGPHVTTPKWMIMPIFEGARFGPITTAIGLRFYDFLAKVKKSERKNMLSREELLQIVPIIKEDGLLGGARFVEYRTDDARLTIEVMKEAVHHGATIINYMKVTDFLYENERITGVSCIDQINGQVMKIKAKNVINAAGPWVDSLRLKDGSLYEKHLYLTKGVHLVFDQSILPLKHSVYFDTPDGRMIFIIPRDGFVYVGTTDTHYNGDLSNPRMTTNDQDYILQAIQFIFPNLRINKSDIVSSWAGIRPLIYETDKGPSEISRKDEIWESPSGLITIAGGKLTGYRKMAEKIVNLVSLNLKREYGKTYSPCKTKTIPISGGHIGGSTNYSSFLNLKVKEGKQLGLNEKCLNRLVKRYGSNIDALFELIKSGHKEAEKFELPIELYAQVVYSIKNEFAYTPVDFFLRRTGDLLFDVDQVRQWKKSVIEMMFKILNWNSEEKDNYWKALEEKLSQLTIAIDEENR